MKELFKSKFMSETIRVIPKTNVIPNLISITAHFDENLVVTIEVTNEAKNLHSYSTLAVY